MQRDRESLPAGPAKQGSMYHFVLPSANPTHAEVSPVRTEIPCQNSRRALMSAFLSRR